MLSPPAQALIELIAAELAAEAAERHEPAPTATKHLPARHYLPRDIDGGEGAQTEDRR